MAGNSTYQVFQTSSTGRWQRFKWAARFVLFLLVLGIAVIIITLSRTNIPDLPHFANAQEKQVLLDTNSSWLNKKSKILSKELQVNVHDREVLDFRRVRADAKD